MAAIITNKFRVFNANKFIEALSVGNNYYMFIGRPQAWPDDLVPPSPVDTVKTDGSIWDSVISMKRITAADATHGIYRRTWTAGKYYDRYRHDYDGTVTGVNNDTGASTIPETLADTNYYVVTTKNNVYVCLKNNGQSTINPDTLGVGGTNFLPVTGADGYVWKFIGTADTTAINHFQSTNYHPIKTLTSAPGSGDPYEVQWNAQQAAKTLYPGAIFTSIVTANGTGYSQSTPPGVVVVGDGVGATATAAVDGTGKVVAINMTNYGTGYTWATISIAPPSSGTQAAAYAILSPVDGLGADPVRDLIAYFVIMYSAFVQAEGSGDFPVTNDYRQIGIVANPKESGGTIPLTLATVTSCEAVKLNSGYSGTWASDSILTDTTSNAIGIIVDSYVDGTDRIVRFIRPESLQTIASANATFNVSDVLSATDGSAGTVAAVLDKTNGGAEVEKYTGDIIYYENRRAIQRASDQTEINIVTFEF